MQQQQQVISVGSGCLLNYQTNSSLPEGKRELPASVPYPYKSMPTVLAEKPVAAFGVPSTSSELHPLQHDALPNASINAGLCHNWSSLEVNPFNFCLSPQIESSKVLPQPASNDLREDQKLTSWLPASLLMSPDVRFANDPWILQQASPLPLISQPQPQLPGLKSPNKLAFDAVQPNTPVTPMSNATYSMQNLFTPPTHTMSQTNVALRTPDMPNTPTFPHLATLLQSPLVTPYRGFGDAFFPPQNELLTQKLTNPPSPVIMRSKEFYVLLRNVPLSLPDKELETLLKPLSPKLKSYNRNNTQCKLQFNSLDDATCGVNSLNGKTCSSNVLEAFLLPR